jgi:hypothetical protein
MSRPSRRRSGALGFTGSRRQLGTTAAAAVPDDGPARAGPHTVAEPVLALAAAVVRLEGALHGEAPERSREVEVDARHGGHPANRVGNEMGPAGMWIHQRCGSNVRRSVPVRAHIGQAAPRRRPVWITPCGLTRQPCTVPDRPSNPTGHTARWWEPPRWIRFVRPMRFTPRGRVNTGATGLPHGGLDHASAFGLAALSTLWTALWKPGLTCGDTRTTTRVATALR